MAAAAAAAPVAAAAAPVAAAAAPATAAAAPTMAAATAAAVPAAAAATSTKSNHPPLMPSSDFPQTVHLFHDSNAIPITTDDIQQNINKIVNKSNNRNNYKSAYKIIKHSTFELRQTYNKLTKTTLNRNDIIIINIMTNDARQTNHRQQRTFHEVHHLQTKILTHIHNYIHPNNVIWLESPPITNGKGDIFPYNRQSYRLSSEWGFRFAETLVGEGHLKWDGFHVRPDSRYLLSQSIACAILHLNPHRYYRLERPPHGEYGPWTSPVGQGMAPRWPTFQQVAASPPYFFRRQCYRPDISPFLDRNIQGQRW